MPPNEIVLVIATGADPAALRGHPRDAFVIAADGGVDAALAGGLSVDAAVGDFDSVTPAGLAEVERQGALVDRHPAAKDATDLELALDHAYARRPARIVLVASGGGRLDHLVSSLLLIARGAVRGSRDRRAARRSHRPRRPRSTRAGRSARLRSSPCSRSVGRRTAYGRTVSRYPLDGETLEPGSSRGVSNVFVGARATVTVDEGVLLAIQPGAEGGAVA